MFFSTEPNMRKLCNIVTSTRLQNCNIMTMTIFFSFLEFVNSLMWGITRLRSVELMNWFQFYLKLI